MLTVEELLKQLSVEAKRSLASTVSDADILDILANDENKFVRAAAMANKAIREETVNSHISDKEYLVRLAVANSPKASIKILIILKSDKELGIRYAAERNLKTTQKNS